MKLEAVRYVFAAYGVALVTLVAWLWLIAMKLRRLGQRGDDDQA